MDTAWIMMIVGSEMLLILSCPIHQALGMESYIESYGESYSESYSESYNEKYITELHLWATVRDSKWAEVKDTVKSSSE